jgi:outer membrane protein assembly factor BamA
MPRFAICLLLLPVCLLAQEKSFPLEDVKISGSQVPAAVVLEIGGLKLGDPINKAGIEEACQKLGQSGIFEAVSYHYEAGPKHGYVVTLELGDPRRMVDAAIDIPGADETGLWTWIASQFPKFQHRVPQSDEAQQYLAGMLERKLGPVLHGQHLVTRMEQDLTKGGRPLLSFQPEHLPHIAAMSFSGQSRLSAEDLNKAMQKVVANDGYTDRHFRMLVEQNLRMVYEQHGMFKAQFPNIHAQEVDPSMVTVATTILEGPQYKLSNVEFVGEDLPADAMLTAAKFKKGEIANWTEIQQSIWRTEVPVKRTGYSDAVSQPERVLDDANQTLLLKIGFRKGPLYHFGQVTFVGLSPDLEAKARKVWKMGTGEPFDFMYSNDFLKAFSQVADLRWVKNVDPKVQTGQGDHVKDLVLRFESK